MCCDRHLAIPGVSNNTTGTLEQKKTNSWTIHYKFTIICKNFIFDNILEFDIQAKYLHL